MQVPETLLGTAIATALLPSLAEFAGKGEWKTFSETLEKAMRVLLALTIPVAAVVIAGIKPLVAVAFGFDEAGTNLLTWTSRVYMLTLVGYAMQETLSRSFYARKEPLMPLLGVMLRLVIYLAIGITGVTLLREIGPYIIAAAELSLAAEAIFMLTMLNRRLERPARVLTAIGKGLVAALLGGITAYSLAVYLPGGAVLTALAGMFVGGVLALVVVWSEFRLLFRL